MQMISETFSLRLNWSTDGSNLLAVNSLHSPSHCACILSREKWDSPPLNVVGHRGAVTVVQCNPVLFQSKDPEDKEPNSCFALGAQVISQAAHFLTAPPLQEHLIVVMPLLVQEPCLI